MSPLSLVIATVTLASVGRDETGSGSPLLHLPFPPDVIYRVICGPGDAPHHTSPRNLHAYDFDMPYGSEVTASAAGTVVRVVSGNQGPTGRSADNNFVAIEHAGGITSEYHHLMQDGALVRVGDRVERGEVIGYSGSSGRAEGAHLHFVVVRDERSVGVRFVECGCAPKKGDRCTSGNVPRCLEGRFASIAELRRAARLFSMLEIPDGLREALIAIAWERTLEGGLPDTPSIRRSVLALRRMESRLRAELAPRSWTQQEGRP